MDDCIPACMHAYMHMHAHARSSATTSRACSPCSGPPARPSGSARPPQAAAPGSGSSGSGDGEDDGVYHNPFPVYDPAGNHISLESISVGRYYEYEAGP